MTRFPMAGRLSLAALLCLLPLCAPAQQGPLARASATTGSSVPDPWPAAIIPDPDAQERRELLLSHGINPLPEDVLGFLQNGFREESLPMGLPREPIMKSEVVNAAIVELGITATQPAVPMLMKIASREFTPAMDALIRRDFESTPIEVADQQIQVARRLLSLNAVVSLGLIGDESAEGTVLDVMAREKGTAFITQGAVALGQMGSAKGLPAVVKLAHEIESPDSAAAFNAIYLLTGRNYGYTEYTGLKKRRALIAKLDEWMAGEGATVAVYRTEVLRRMQAPPREAIVDTKSLQALLRESLNAFDYDSRYTARRQLAERGKVMVKELRTLATDDMEDLDIRSAAMRWLAMVDADEAESTMRKLRKDENPSIASAAREILKDIPAYKAEEKAKQ